MLFFVRQQAWDEISEENYENKKINADDYKLENYRLRIRINMVCSVYRVKRIMHNCIIENAIDD